MSASQVLLAGHGPEDRWLTEAPNRTYFEAKYNPRVNRLRETFEVPFDNQDATFGGTGRCTIPVKGDYLTRLTLRTVMPPIYPTQAGQYVYPTPSSQVGGTVYVNKTLTAIVADGVTLTANTAGNHYFSIGASVSLAGTAYTIFDLDGTYTVASIPTANSFTCLTTLAGISYNGTVSTPGIQCGDVISYFSTANSNLWVNNLTNKTWQITNAVFNGPGTELTVTTSTPSGFSAGQTVHVIIKSLIINGVCTVVSATDTTFTITATPGVVFVAVADDGKSMYSLNSGGLWESVASTPAGLWKSVAYGNGTLVAVSGYGLSMYSTTSVPSWTLVSGTPSGQWTSVAYGNGTFVAVSYNGKSMYSNTNVPSWATPLTTPAGSWQSVAYGNGTFVAVSIDGQSMYSNTNVPSWTVVPVTPSGQWSSVAYGNGTFVAVSFDGQSMYSNTNVPSWTLVSGTPSSRWFSIAYGNGTFVAVSGDVLSMYSNTNVPSWTVVPVTPSGQWSSVAYGNGTFVAVSGGVVSMYSNTIVPSWTLITGTPRGLWTGVAVSITSYTLNNSDIAYIEPPPLSILYNPSSTEFEFYSTIYPSISFANSSDAAFWGFDSRNGLTYSLPATPPWTLTQSGWISGLLPPSTSTYDDSVTHKLCKAVRIMVGKQTIKEYSGEYIELHNDLLVPYENKAILKLMNGTLDETQATVAREYYTTLPLGTKEIPLCALTRQQMSVEIDFDSYLNLSQNLNAGTGDFLDAKSYATYNASTGVLGGQPVNVQTTFSYQQYIFIVTYGGQFIIYDTTQDVADPGSYIVLSAFSGSSLFSQFCVLSGNLYIGLTNGQLARMIITELIQGNISSFIVNNYTPTTGSLTGTIVADFRYVYYTVSNTVTSNVFFTQYDTTGVFTNQSSYTSFDFTKDIDSSATSSYQFISTGSQLIALTNTPGNFYTFNLNANFTTEWNSVYYSSVAIQITSGVLIGKTVYFIGDGFRIIKYINDVFTNYILDSVFVAVSFDGESMYSLNSGRLWESFASTPYGYWQSVAYGNGTLVAVSFDRLSMYSNTNVPSWSLVSGTPPERWSSIAYGNGTFVAVSGDGLSMYSNTNVPSWTLVPVTPAGSWQSVAYGNGTFVAVSIDGQSMYSNTNVPSWTVVPVTPSGQWYSIAYGNGTFVAVSIDGQSMYSNTNVPSWTVVPVTPSGQWVSIAYGNGTFVAVSIDGQSMYSTTGVPSWTVVPVTPPGEWLSIAYGNGTFVAVSVDGQPMYSTTGVPSWTLVSGTPSGLWTGVTSTDTAIFPNIGSGLTNLLAVGTKIYASSNSSSISSVVQIDTTKDLNTSAAYQYYTSQTPNSPISFDGTALKIFANGPRYVYMFTNNAAPSPMPTTVYEFDPYPPTPILNASILVDYESLPEGVTKPDKALIGLVQTQKVTDMAHMDIHGPVKELWVTGASDSANVFQYSNLATQSTLSLAGERIVTDDDGTHTFLNVIEPFETHTTMPIRNVSVVSFEFDPESDVPNGTINFSRIRDQVFDGNAQTVWARNYNLLAIQGGTGGLMFN